MAKKDAFSMVLRGWLIFGVSLLIWFFAVPMIGHALDVTLRHWGFR